MAADLENLATIRSNLIAKLAEISANPKPTYSIDGQSVDWQSFYDSLWNQLDKLNQQISIAQGPFEELGQATT